MGLTQSIYRNIQPIAVELLQNVTNYGRPWPAVYITFVQITHQIQVLTEPFCRAQPIFYALPNIERGTKYRGLANLSVNL